MTLTTLLAKCEDLAKEFQTNYSAKQGRDLTDDEKFAIAYCSGVSIELSSVEESSNAFKVNLTTELCSVVWDGHKFLVARMAK